MRHDLTDTWSNGYFNSGTDLFSQTVNRWLNGFASPVIQASSEVAYPLACDIEENETHYVVTLDMPGIPKEDIKLEIVDGKLSVSGERKHEHSEEKKARFISERTYGKFVRTIALPAEVEVNKIEAAYKDGVLTVAIPKAEAAKPKQIEIKDAESGLFSKLVSTKKKEQFN